MNEPENDEPKSKKWLKPFRSGLAAITTIAAIVIVIYGATAWIDFRVETKISDDAFIQKLSRNLRPFVIFDSNNSIVYDQGAMDYIDHIHADTAMIDGCPVVRKITVSPKQFLVTPPLLDCIDLKDHIYRPVRGQKFDWIYELTNENEFGPSVIRFRMEVLR
jgi:hypothetical protein